MTTALLLGASFGVGLWALARGLFPPRFTLAQMLAALNRPPAQAPIIAVNDVGVAVRLGLPFVAALRGLGLPAPSIRRDLLVLGQPAEQHLAVMAATALVGLAFPPAASTLLTFAGFTVPLGVPVGGSLLLGALGFFTPILNVQARARKRRADFRHALSSVLDLVVISLAGGSGIDGALHDASEVGDGWAAIQIRRALETARLTRQPLWTTLAQLGTEIQVQELTELSASVALAGTEGARVRASLAAKAAALRMRQTTDAETRAQSATERMSLPVVLLFVAFLLLIGYPSVSNVLSGL